MRVEARHQDARPGDAEVAAQVGIDDGQRLDQHRDVECVRHRAQRQVGGGQRHAQHGVVVGGLRAGQHHHHARHGGALGQVFGVAGERHARVVDRALLHRRGDHRRVFAGLQAVDGGIEQRQHVAAVAGVKPARLALHAERHILNHHPALADLAGPGMPDAQRCGPAGQQTGIPQHMEAVVPVAVAIAAGKLQQRPDRDVGADAGRFSGGNG
ncbi:hypothetical protein D3C81_1422000 [compost metagenome]